MIMYFIPTVTCFRMPVNTGHRLEVNKTTSHYVLGWTCEAMASLLTVLGTQCLNESITQLHNRHPACAPAHSLRREWGILHDYQHWSEGSFTSQPEFQRKGSTRVAISPNLSHAVFHTLAHLILTREVETLVLWQMIQWRMKGQITSLWQQR